ncbi:HAD-IIIC family phosphatase [Parabacteroides distasonis]|uniref:HAD-IIIC family phosphatase n=1 Tax=Parabacteroides distasonis TaxID=823 RepID=UPI002162D1D0|nr:HAD-IIIC family phosphatase [Parabacteroides distasonis]UVQ79841.1 HAD-IIIC family phosphatase [Parabacteroides distasonis]
MSGIGSGQYALGGVLGEDGIDGIKIGGDYPGKAFLYFQEGLLELAKRGVILTICSKNNERDVLDLWEKNPFVLLRKEHFSAWRINWRNKADNIRELSEELNIGLDSLVFVDDNPTERELVRQMLPMVEVPEFPKQSYMLPDFLISLSDRYFRVYSVTEEDRRKTEQYKANASRTQERKKFVDFDQYLQSLEIEMRIEPMNSFNVSRIAQMTQKTNQFNLTTRRCSESDLMGFSSEGWLIYCLSVKDRFGDNGITGAVLLRPIDGGYEIDSFLLSCRILGKGIEEAFLSGILNILRNRGVKLVKASYIPTAKNMQVSGFYERTDFVLDSQDKDGSKFYHLNMGAEIKIPSYYKITY